MDFDYNDYGGNPVNDTMTDYDYHVNTRQQQGRFNGSSGGGNMPNECAIARIQFSYYHI